MLELLHIENVAVIEHTDIEFGSGLNVLTGETGAGKSIIIDAIGCILGGRSSKELVRTGAAAAVISAELSVLPDMAEKLREMEIDSEEGLVITRKITAEGKSSCRINGIPVSAAQLREVGELLFDVHGQNDGRRLLSETNHKKYLDTFGGLTAEQQDYAALYRAYAHSCEELEALKAEQEDKEYLEEKLQNEIRELERISPQANEEEALEQEAAKLRNIEKLRDKLEDAVSAFDGGENSMGAVSELIVASQAIEAAVRLTESFRELSELIVDLRYRAEDISDRLNLELRNLDHPAKLDHIEERLKQLKRMVRRYGSTAAAAERLTQARMELEDVSCLDDRIEQLEHSLEEQKKKTLLSAKRLSEGRHKAAERLSRAVEQELKDLSMPGSVFRVEFSPKNGAGFDAGGMEDICFLLSANAGEKPGHLSRIASGGELSRIMLALKKTLSSVGDDAVMVFDEIDTGVSGIAAQRVGEKLSDLAAGRQVLCVTHLPQLAAIADEQFCIAKQQNAGRTFTQVTRLDSEGRKRELARLIGGDVVTELTLQNAEELISEAQKYKTRLSI